MLCFSAPCPQCCILAHSQAAQIPNWAKATTSVQYGSSIWLLNLDGIRNGVVLYTKKRTSLWFNVWFSRPHLIFDPYPTVQVALCTCQGFGGTSVTGEIARSNLRDAAGDESLLRVWLKISEPVVRSMSHCRQFLKSSLPAAMALGFPLPNLFQLFQLCPFQLLPEGYGRCLRTCQDTVPSNLGIPAHLQATVWWPCLSGWGSYMISRINSTSWWKYWWFLIWSRQTEPGGID